MALSFTRAVADNSVGIPDTDLNVPSLARPYYGTPLGDNGGIEQRMVTDFQFDGVTGGTAPYFFDFSGVQVVASLQELVAAGVWENRLDHIELVGPGSGVAEGGSFVFRVKMVPWLILATYVSWELQGELYIAPGSYIRVTDAAGAVTNLPFGNNGDYGDTPVVGISGFRRRLVAGTADPLAIECIGYPDATQGVPYTFQMTATGGIKPYRWGKNTPFPNFVVDYITGEITDVGSPVAGTYSVDWKLTDAAGVTTTCNWSIVVVP